MLRGVSESLVRERVHSGGVSSPRRNWEVRFGRQGWDIVLVSDLSQHLFGTGSSDNPSLRVVVCIRYTYLVQVFSVSRGRSSYLPAADHLQTAPTKSGFSPSQEPIPLLRP